VSPMTANGELRLVGGLALVKPKDTPREKMFAAFFRVFSTDTDERADEEFELRAAAAVRAAEGYFLSQGWKKPAPVPSGSSLPLFGAAK
jgi:hypothetical protein